MLIRAILLQKWFGIHSDPELENQINGRLSFKSFIGLPVEDLSPDHSIIIRFRDRVGKKALEKIHEKLFSAPVGCGKLSDLWRSVGRWTTDLHSPRLADTGATLGVR